MFVARMPFEVMRNCLDTFTTCSIVVPDSSGLGGRKEVSNILFWELAGY